ncbi:hypothetical protein BDV24DRAFT_146003 [Aspergillus arachidicola]|uniref:Uncharacterized protein n=1 Tax=Aspergillus arachidicola TaxID=656916 RepID=A0A5N6XM63_9EURO|nr:hypothetical protein BDV24DRAFT_146003 [Aspergillus arachidicola]
MSSVQVMDIAFLLNHNEGEYHPISHQPQIERSPDGLKQCYPSDYLFHQPSLAIQPAIYMRSLIPPGPNWEGATRSEHALGMSHTTTVTNSSCGVHLKLRDRRASFRPMDDATILYLSEAIQGSPRAAMQLVSRRGTVATDARRDALYGYKPTRNCLDCRCVHLKLVKIKWQYQDVSWNIKKSNSNLKTAIVIPPPRRVRLRDTFCLPLILQAPQNTTEVSAKLEIRGIMSPLNLTKASFHKETFIL